MLLHIFASFSTFLLGHRKRYLRNSRRRLFDVEGMAKESPGYRSLGRGGQRSCINGSALRFIPADKLEAEGYGYLRNIMS